MGKQIADCVDCGETTMCCIEWKELEARELGYIQSLRELEATIAEQRKLMENVVDGQSLGAVENAITAIENYQNR